MTYLIDDVQRPAGPNDRRDRPSVRPPPRRFTGASLGAALALLACLGGCKAVEPAPEDLDGLFHYFWAQHDDGPDEGLAEALVNFSALVDEDYDLDAEEVYDGTLSDITQEQLDQVGMRDDADPSVNAGMYLINDLACTLDQVEQIVSSLDQFDLYEGAYDAYDREYTSDLDEYLARSEPHLTWISHIDATLMGASYHEDVHGDLRFVPELDAEQSPFGWFLVARYHMPEEAEFGNDDFFFTQDYQLEIYYERSAGEVIHLYGLWRHMGFGEASTDDEAIQRLVLNGLADWDDQTEALCASGDF